MNRLKNSLGLWLSLVVLAATVPVLCAIIASGLDLRKSELAQAEAGALSLVQALAAEQEGVTLGVWQLLSTLSQVPDTQRLEGAACSRLFADIASINASLANITLADRDGNVVASARPFSQPISLAGTRHVEAAMRTSKFSAGEYGIGRVSGIPVIAFAYPVLKGPENLLGVLTCSLDLHRYHELFVKAKLPSGSVFVVLDHAGTRLMVYPPFEQIPEGGKISAEVYNEYASMGEEGLSRHAGADGVMRYYAFRKVRLKPDEFPYLTMVIGVPEAQILAKADQATQRSLAAGGLAAVVSLALAFVLAKFGILSKVDRLARAARRIESGDLDVRAEPEVGGGAFGLVARAFDDMAAALKARRQELTQAESQARDAKTFIQNIIDSMPSVMVGVDCRCRVTMLNTAAVRQIGLPLETVLGLAVEAVSKPLASVKPDIELAMQTGSPVLLAGRRDPSAAGGEGPVVDILIYPLAGQGSRGAVVRVDDVTQRERMSEMMVQTEKMMSVGALAAGMAHEINNPLSGVMQSAQVLARRLSEDSAANRAVAEQAGVSLSGVQDFLRRREVPALLEGIRDSGRRAGNIVSNMLEFSRNNEAHRSSVDLGELLDKTVELAASDYDLKKMYDFKRIRIVRDYDPAMPQVACSRSEMEQVFLNLLKNAAQALWLDQGAGREPVVTLRTRLEQGYAMVQVIDNGPGMEDAVRKRVFEPFFTTKEPGQGTGLGLSVSYFIINAHHGGSIRVCSAPGQGAAFTLRLPLNGEASKE